MRRPTVKNNPPSCPSVAYPSHLRQPSLGAPVVRRVREQLPWLVGEQRAWIGPQVLDAILGKPPLHLGERVAMLFGMLILIAQPRLAPRRLVSRSSQHRIEWDEPESRKTRHDTAKPRGQRARTCCRRLARSSRPAAQVAPGARTRRADSGCGAAHPTSTRRRTRPPCRPGCCRSVSTNCTRGARSAAPPRRRARAPRVSNRRR